MPDDQIREVFITSLPAWMETMLRQSALEWDDMEAVSDQKLLTYLSNAELIGRMVNGNGQPNNEKKPTAVKAKKGAAKHKTWHSKECTYCKRKGHLAQDCRFKKRDAEKNKAAENFNMEVEENAEAIQELINNLHEN